MTVPDKNGVADHRLKILIIGGGLCGLATAISSCLAGHSVIVFESAPQLQEIGAGIQITPNGSRLLQRWGVWDKVAASVTLLSELSVRRSDGQLLARRTSYDEEVKRKYGTPICCLHRADFHKALAQRASELGAELRVGSKVVDIEFDQNSIKLANGQTEHGDLIIAADGLWSTTRPIFLGHDAPPKPTGDLAYRVVLKADQLDSPELIELVDSRSLNLWIGPDKHAVAFGIRNAGLFNMAFLVPDTLLEGVGKHSGNVDSLRQLFEGWDPMLV
jgi:salicylate hydroxylase